MSEAAEAAPGTSETPPVNTGEPASTSTGGSLLSQAGTGGSTKVTETSPPPGEKSDKGNTEEGQPSGKEAAPPVLPASLESLKLPEGQVWDEKIGGEFIALMNDEKLGRQELAQKLVDMYLATSGNANAIFEAEIDRVNTEMRQKWLESSSRDKEFGGDKWETAQVAIARGRNHLATAEAVDILNESGLCNHPEILRMFYRGGMMLSEDSADGARSLAPALKSDEEVFYEKK